jgi:cytochrome c
MLPWQARPGAALLAAILAVQPVQGQQAAGDAVRGERQFQRCLSCHSVDPGEQARLQGPSLHRLLGRPAAAVAGFDYSDAMRAEAAAGLVWERDTLERYIADPDGFLPGISMSLPPLRDAQDRADLIAFLARSGRHGE